MPTCQWNPDWQTRHGYSKRIRASSRYNVIYSLWGGYKGFFISEDFPFAQKVMYNIISLFLSAFIITNEAQIPKAINICYTAFINIQDFLYLSIAYLLCCVWHFSAVIFRSTGGAVAFFAQLYVTRAATRKRRRSLFTQMVRWVSNTYNCIYFKPSSITFLVLWCLKIVLKTHVMRFFTIRLVLVI